MHEGLRRQVAWLRRVRALGWAPPPAESLVGIVYGEPIELEQGLALPLAPRLSGRAGDGEMAAPRAGGGPRAVFHLDAERSRDRARHTLAYRAKRRRLWCGARRKGVESPRG